MMRRLAALIYVIIMTYTIVFAAPISFHDSEPTNGTEISTFNIQLKFDVSETIQKQGTDNLGIRYVGDSYGCTISMKEMMKMGNFWQNFGRIHKLLKLPYLAPILLFLCRFPLL